ncbi:MAG: hypothetical protein H0T20_02935 [Actinobacteria bacterium]|nr:hypothetical protein [Actinomycetota bacterium]
MPGVFRSLGATIAVGAVSGLVVAGAGSRLAMRLIALADDREDFGFRTDAEAIVGEATVSGTLFVLFVGIVLGVIGAFLYLGLRRWLPVTPVYRTLVFAIVIVGLGLALTIEGNQGDFVFLHTVLSIVAFAAVLLLYGLVVPPLLDWLSPPAVGRSLWGRGLVAAILVAALSVGALAVKHAFEFADGSRLPG